MNIYSYGGFPYIIHCVIECLNHVFSVLNTIYTHAYIIYKKALYNYLYVYLHCTTYI